MPAMARKIVKIDEARCNGCGLCVPKCAEGAIQIVEGKARLAAENLCDGLGACLGQCPQGAITIEDRPAEAFDEHAVEQHKRREQRPSHHSHGHAGCPGAMMRKLQTTRTTDAKPQADTAAAAESVLRHWPVQLALVPVRGEMWHDADVLVAADCVAFAMPDFQARLLPGKSLAIACPKLDDIEPYIEKLAEIFGGNDIRSITVAHMEVPCCGGIVYAVRQALVRCDRNIPVRDITVGIDGTVQSEN